MVDDLPRLMLLILPGYVAVRFFYWASTWRQHSDLEIVIWSVGAALALLVPLSQIWARWFDGPTFDAIVNSGAQVPLTMNATMLPCAVLLGTLVGTLDRHEVLHATLRVLRIDLGRREDVWFALFRRKHWVEVVTTDGRRYFGWPHRWSRDRQGAATELYLIDVETRDEGTGEWVPLNDVDGIWFDSSGIHRVLFVPAPRSDTGKGEADTVTRGSPEAGREATTAPVDRASI